MSLGGPGATAGADLLARLLSAASLRAEVIANNIANQNTPGFRRQTVRFEELLRGALAGPTSAAGEAHASAARRLAALEPRIEEDRLTPPRADGNNVTLELEMNALRQNQLLYEAYAAVLATRFEVLRASVESGR